MHSEHRERKARKTYKNKFTGTVASPRHSAGLTRRRPIGGSPRKRGKHFVFVQSP